MGKRDGVPNIFPEIIYEDCPAALVWLAKAFGFVQGEVIEGPDGTIAHAEMHLDDGTIMPKSPTPEWGMRSPRTFDGVHQCIYVTVEDPDAHHERAKVAGAQIVMEPTDLDYGARNYCARDLEGHLWSFGTYSPRTDARPGV
ncbi:MAG: hypothetical protein GEV09_10690 [Pseudonocardiaceae bacterium]|nr:hypothetical protein [Pseudonocardiaceae bacterium]